MASGDWNVCLTTIHPVRPEGKSPQKCGLGWILSSKRKFLWPPRDAVAENRILHKCRLHLLFTRGLLWGLMIIGRNDESRFNIRKAYRNHFRICRNDRDIAENDRRCFYLQSLPLPLPSHSPLPLPLPSRSPLPLRQKKNVIR